MQNYGFEDWDFVNRLELHGCKRTFIEDQNFLRFISHSEEERYTLNDAADLFYGIYLKYITPWSSEVIFLFRDYTFEKGTLIDNWTSNASDFRNAYQRKNSRFEFSLLEKQWLTGYWRSDSKDIILTVKEENKSIRLEKAADHLIEHLSSSTYYLISNKASSSSLVGFSYFYRNRCIMERHLEELRITVNNSVFGEGEVTRYNPIKHHIKT
jgi:hypothetical protein